MKLAELKMDVLREREVKDSLERQLNDEKKIRAVVQHRLRKERRQRRRVQQQLEAEVKRRIQMEEALKSAGAAEQLRIINENINNLNDKSSPATSSSSEREKAQVQQQQQERADSERVESPSGSYQHHHQQQQQQQTVREPPPPPLDTKPWGYSGIDLMNTGAAFWQNYSESLAQELELERKSRQQQVEQDVKPSLHHQDRTGYYKNSVLFTSTAT